MTVAPWKQAPMPGELRPRSWPSYLAATLIATAGPGALAWSAPGRAMAAGCWSVAVGAVVLGRHLGGGLERAMVVAAAVVLTVGVEPAAGVWLGLGWFVARWVVDGIDIPVLGFAGPGAMVPCTVVAVVAAWSVLRSHPVVVTMALLVASIVLPLLSRWRGGALDRAAKAVGRGAGTVVIGACFTVLGAVVLPASWLLRLVAGGDETRAPGGWASRQRRDGQARQPWGPEVRASPPAISTRATALALVVVALPLLVTPQGRSMVGGWWPNDVAVRNAFTLGRGEDVGEAVGEVPELREPVPPGIKEYSVGPTEVPAAHAANEWFRAAEYSDAQAYALDPTRSWRPVNPYRMLDFRSRYVNVVNGQRMSWTPPECGCRRLKVWMYGGSTTWGLDQRDDHTIASELARRAHEAGLTIDVENRGDMGALHWMEAERFGWDLTVDEPPDLVVFYDGVNDAWAAAGLDAYSADRLDPPIDATLVDLWRSTGRSEGSTPEPPPGARLVPRDTSGLGITELPLAAVQRYDRSRVISQRSADAHGVLARYAWQPSRYSRPLVIAEPHSNTERENYSRLQDQMMADSLPEDVIDLTDALDGNRDPLFTDDVHHNEEGARLIAEALFEHLRADLLALLGDD